MNKDKMKLEDAIKIYNGLKKNKEIIKNIDADFFFEFSETVLQALENSIPKKKIEDKIKAYEKLIDDVSESEQYSNEIPLYRHDIQVLQELLEDK